MEKQLFPFSPRTLSMAALVGSVGAPLAVQRSPTDDFYCALCPFPFCPASVPKHIRNTWQSACKSRPEGLPLQKVIAHYNP